MKRLRNKLKPIAKAIAAIAGATLPVMAYADPVSIAYMVASLAASSGYYWTAAAIIAVATVASYTDTKRKAKHAREDAAREYNAGLKELGQLIISADPDIRDIYGERAVGGHVVAGFASDKTAYRDDGTSYTRPDGYKHIVIAIGRGPITSFDDVLIDGESIGALDGSGYVTEGKYFKSGTYENTITIPGTGYIDIGNIVVEVIRATSTTISGDNQSWNDELANITLSLGNTRITGPIDTIVTYTATRSNQLIRVQTYLGTDAQTANAYLISVSGGKWTSAHRGLGWAYAIVTLDLEHEPFQAGLPQITFKVKGLKVYDPRKDSTNGGSGAHRLATPSTWEYTQCAALISAKHLHSDIGMRVDPTVDIDWASVIIAANDCDTLETPSYIDEADVVTEGTPQPRFTVDGVISSNDSPESVLDNLTGAMAGFPVYGAQWSIYTGTWRTPVDTFTDDDLDGEISILQTGTALDELINGINATYVGSGKANPTDIVPYQNSTLVTTDGENLWGSKTFTFTNDAWRATQLCRVEVEKNRLGLVIQYPAKLDKWQRCVGERVYITNAEYGYTDKPFMITDWQFGETTPVVFTLEEDQASIYDIIDTVRTLAENVSDLPDPNVVQTITGVTLATGNDHVIINVDGTTVPRVKVSWTAITDRYAAVGGHIQISWHEADNSVTRTMRVPATDTSAYIEGFAAGRWVIISLKLWNGFTYGDVTFASIQVLGASGAYQAVADFSVTIVGFYINFKWTRPTNAIWAYTELRVGASWAAGEKFFAGRVTEYTRPHNVSGNYTVWAKHYSWDGRESASAASVTFDYVANLAINSLKLEYTSFAFLFDPPLYDESTSPDITLTSLLNGITGSPTFVATAYNAAGTSLGVVTLTTVDAYNRTLSPAQFQTYANTNHVKVVCSLVYETVTYTDQMTIFRGNNGSNALNLRLGNEMINVPTLADGTGAVFTDASTSVTMYEGITDVTSLWTFARADTGVTSLINGAAGPISGTGTINVAVSAMSVNFGYVTITATRTDYPTQTAFFKILKSYAGEAGLVHRLTRDAILLPVYPNGEISSWLNAVTVFYVEQGPLDISSDWTFTPNANGIDVLQTGTNNNVFTVTGFTPPYADDMWSLVFLLLHGEGTHGSNTFVDSSSYGRTMSITAGSPIISNAHPVFGSTSIYGGTASTRITTSMSDMGTLDDWTWETRYRREGTGDHTGLMYINGKAIIVRNESGNFVLKVDNGGSYVASSTTLLSLYTDYHLEVSCKKVGAVRTLRLFVNGTKEVENTSGFALTPSIGGFDLGRTGSAGFAGLNAYIDEYRLTAGCRHTSNFAVPDYQLPDNADPIGPTPTSGYVEITAERDGFVSVVKRFTVDTGVSSIVVTPKMLPEFATVPATAAGVVTSYTGAATVITITVDGVDDTANWTFDTTTSTGVTISGADTASIAVTAMTDAIEYGYVDVVATKTNYLPLSGRFIVYKVYATAVVAAHIFPGGVSLPSTSDGVVTDYTGAAFAATVLVGGVDDTANWTFDTTNSTGVSTTGDDTDSVTITALTDAINGGYVDVVASKSGYDDEVMRFNISKAKSGTPSGTLMGANYGAINVIGEYIAIRFLRNGGTEVKRSSAGSWVSIGAWFGLISTTVGDGYYLKVVNSGDAFTSGATVGSYLQLNTDREFIFESSTPGTYTMDLKVYIATSNVGANAVIGFGLLELEVV